MTPSGDAVVESSAAAPADSKTWTQRRVILDRNLFHASTEGGAAAILSEPLEDVEATRLPLDLLGTAAADDPRLAWAAVNDRETRDTLIVGIDDVLKEKATVVRIERRRGLLLENGVHREQPTAARGRCESSTFGPSSARLEEFTCENPSKSPPCL